MAFLTNASSPLGAPVEEDSVDIVFHGVAYNIAVTVAENATPEPTLAVDLEDLTSGQAWHGEFSASYLENITSKTGSFKRFQVLVKMLMGSLRQQTETVFLDLLTYSDLEALRNKKAQQKGAPASSTAAGSKTSAAAIAGAGKRYLILTYVVEFDRVHYPLPLAFEEAPTLATTQRLARRLRRELVAFKSLAGLTDSGPGLTATGLPASAAAALSSSVSGLQRENAVLRQMLQEKEGKENAAQENIRNLTMKVQGMQEAATAGDAAIEKLRAASRAEVKRLREELVDARGGGGGGMYNASNSENNSNNNNNNNNNNEAFMQMREVNEQLRAKIQELTRQLALATSSSSNGSASTARGRGTTRSAGGGGGGGGGGNNTPTNRGRSGSVGSQHSRGTSPASTSNNGLNSASKRGMSATSRQSLSMATSAYSTTTNSNRHSTPTRNISTAPGGKRAAGGSQQQQQQRTPTSGANLLVTPGSTASGPRAGASRVVITPGSAGSRSNSAVRARSAAATHGNGRSTTPGGMSVHSTASSTSAGNRGHSNSAARVGSVERGGGNTNSSTSSSPSAHHRSATAIVKGIGGGNSISSVPSVGNTTTTATAIRGNVTPTSSTARKTTTATAAHSASSQNNILAVSSSSSSARSQQQQQHKSALNSSPYLNGVGPVLASIEKNFKERTTTSSSSSAASGSSTPNGGRASGSSSTGTPTNRVSSAGGVSRSSSRSKTSVGGGVSSRGSGGGGGGIDTIQQLQVTGGGAGAGGFSVEPPEVSRNTKWTEPPPVVPALAPPPAPATLNQQQASASSSSSSVGIGSGTVSPGGTKYNYDSSTEIHDIDARLQQLQDFLKAAKTGAPLPTISVG